MNIYIPTRGRLNKQITWDGLPESIRKRTFLVCPPDEYDAHVRAGRQSVCYPGQEGIIRKRQWIMDTFGDAPFCMMDDDLRFYVRKSPEAWNLRYSEGEDIEHLFFRCRQLLEQYAQVGLSGRQGNNHFFPETQVTCGRVTNFHCYNPALYGHIDLRFHDPSYPDTFTMEDFHVTLTLLSAGLENCIITDHAWDQPTSNNEGGCALYRNAESQRQSAELLAARHPGLVKVLEKQTKTSWKGLADESGSRTDVMIYWRKAYEQSQRKEASEYQSSLF